MGEKTLYLVDGTSQLFRAYFAISGLTNADGLPTNAVYGFTTMLRKLMQEERPPYLGVAFDTRGPVFRHETYAEYKANRPPAPEDLNVQVPYAKQVCEVLGVPVLELQGFEADDLIATCTRQARSQGFEVVVVASDKDLLQLVGEGVTVLNPSKEIRLDAEGVTGSFGVPPERVQDVLGLMGDSVDNVPGVPGVGQKTALEIVGRYGDLEAVIERARAFQRAYDARDALVAAIDTAAAENPLGRDSATAVTQAGHEAAGALASLIEVERDDAVGRRLQAALALLRDAPVEGLAGEVGGPGKRAVKPLASLKRELKALDRGSSKRIWYAIADSVDQARLSKELVTLHVEAPVDFDPQRFASGEHDVDRARELFGSLGFTTLLDDFLAATDATERSAAPVVQESELILSRAALQAFCDRCAGDGTLALLPLGRRSPVGIAMARPGESVYLPLAHVYLGAPDQLHLDDVRPVLGPLLADSRIAKVAHDVKQAIHRLARVDLPVHGWSLDTMVAAFLLHPGRSAYALETLSREFLARDPGEAVPASADQEVEPLARWAGSAAAIVLELAAILDDRLDSAGLRSVWETIDGPLLPVLAEMEAHGIRVDVPLLERMSEEMRCSIDTLRGEIHRLAGCEFNVDSPKQLREILFERLGLKPRRKTAKSRAASTDAQTLEELAAEHPIAGKLLEYRELTKLKSTYVDSLPRLVDAETGRVHTSYHATGAATGRLSSSDPNLQNIPVRSEAGKRIRAAFIPEPGSVFLASDYSQIELRILAHLADDAELIAAFRAGEDIHRHTASKVFDVHPDLVSDGMRRRAKAVNFGILYGMSETRLAREQGMTRTEARKFIQAYFDRFAAVREYIDAVREQASRDGAVHTLFGRVRLFPQLRQQVNRAVREQALRAAVNTTLQGTAADLMKLAMLAVSQKLARESFGARILLQVHDELLLEVPAESARPLAELVRGAMEGVHRLKVPLVVDQKVGNNWFEAT